MRCRDASGMAAIVALCVFAVPVHPSDRPLVFRDVDVFDGSRVLRHYDQGLGLRLTEQEKSDLVEFLKTL